jgi:tryptophan synthase beta chain
MHEADGTGGRGPDVIIGCVGGGSNFAGIAFPFLRRKNRREEILSHCRRRTTLCASLTKGELRYDFGDTAESTPLLMMYTLGHNFMPPKIHAGGLRYHGMAPTVSHAHKLG